MTPDTDGIYADADADADDVCLMLMLLLDAAGDVDDEKKKERYTLLQIQTLYFSNSIFHEFPASFFLNCKKI